MKLSSTRRLLLQASLFGASFTLPGFASAVLSSYSVKSQSVKFNSGFNALRNIVCLGNDYFKQLPQETTPEDLVRLIASATRDSTLDQVIRNDFTEGKVTYLNGWALSITEARYYALLALNVNQRGN